MSKKALHISKAFVVRSMGLEPIRLSHTALNRARLPFRHDRIIICCMTNQSTHCICGKNMD